MEETIFIITHSIMVGCFLVILRTAANIKKDHLPLVKKGRRSIIAIKNIPIKSKEEDAQLTTDLHSGTLALNVQ